MNDFLSIVCYMAGDWISRSPICNFNFGASAYQKLMAWSVNFDKKEKIWRSVK